MQDYVCNDRVEENYCEGETPVKQYIDYIMEITSKLLAVPSPSGFTHMAAEFVKKEFESMGYEPKLTAKGAVLVKLGENERDGEGRKGKWDSAGCPYGYSGGNGVWDQRQRQAEIDEYRGNEPQ